MINAPQLLADLKRRLISLEGDLRERIHTLPEIKTSLQTEWQAARDANRTAEPFETWADQVITQAGVHWLLSCVFLRFIEDNSLVDRPWIGGTPDSGRLNLARDRHEAYFREHPLESDRDYLLDCFTEAATLPGLRTFFDQTHNPIFRLGISGDAAMALRQFWQQQDPNTGALLHDFTDASWNTRFLGDLYQDLSEATRKRYALLQTPEFVEVFILDRTLTPAIREFGYREVRMIDPTCGSGHFLLGGFQRLIDEWSRAEPTRNRRDVAQKALDSVAGVDLNPFAVAISRFRLLVAALKASDVHRLREAPDFTIHVAIGDSLLHGKRFGLTTSEDMFQGAEHFSGTGLAHAYASEDLAEVQGILGRQYHAVVGNPPYIVVADAALNTTYRKLYASCHRQYSLGAPFTERFFELAATGRVGHSAGFVGLITTNSFMKREFGTKLIKEVLPRLDLTHVIDTSVAHIPGHGTPTVILLGRHRAPVNSAIRTVRGIKGEPTQPNDPARGLVWTSIIDLIDHPGSETEYVSADDTPRDTFAIHPWNIGGGGATTLVEVIESVSTQRLSEISEVYGGTGRTSGDDVLVAPKHAFSRRAVDAVVVFTLVEGDQIRDWQITWGDAILTPYSAEGLTPIATVPGAHRWLWPTRTVLGNRVTFGKQTYFEEGRAWWAWHQINVSRLSYSYAITFSFVSTHNHFVLDRGGKVFKQSAQVIRLPASAPESEYLGLLGLLNSSVACFWFQQVCHNKGGPGGGSSKDEKWHDFYEFNSTRVAEFPLVGDCPIEQSRRIDRLGHELARNSPAAVIFPGNIDAETPTRQALDSAGRRSRTLRYQLIAAQEELDWHCYDLYGLLSEPLETSTPPEVRLGERAFEIVMARRVAAGSLQTRWFEWLGISPVTDIPEHWSPEYRALVKRRIELIESDRSIGLVEAPNCKRRWEMTAVDLLEQAALRDWLLARLELPRYWTTSSEQPPRLTSTSHLADAAQLDADFMQVATLYAGHANFDPGQLVAQLVTNEAAPFLPVLRYTEAGLRKRSQWEDTWALQRREDTGEEVGKIPVPPKYKSTDFLKTDVWRLRGGLDVPKERWISYPGCERGADGSLMIAWAGWDHLQQATALAGFYLDMKDNEGWTPERLQPLLAGLLELVPWLEQWHNEVDPVYGERMGHYYKGFVTEEARAQGFTLDELKAWKPIATAAKRGRTKTAV